MLSWPVGLDDLDRRALAVGGEPDILGPHAQHHGRALVTQRVRADERPRQFQRQTAGLEGQSVAVGPERALDEVHPRRADEPGDEHVGRL